MIRGFKHKGLQAFSETGSKKGVRPDHADKLDRILTALDVAEVPVDVDLPAYRLHELQGNLAGTWSIKVNGNWRITFSFTRSDVDEVDYQDYH